MQAEGYAAFTVIGHDRGAQVAYRMALDSPERITRLGVMDNLPVFAVWELIAAHPGMLPHWKMLADPTDAAEQSLTEEYLLELMRTHTASGTLDGFQEATLASYREDWQSPARRHALAEDYRAGAAVDLAHDEADLQAGRKNHVPDADRVGKMPAGAVARVARSVLAPELCPRCCGRGAAVRTLSAGRGSE